jgi:predicted NBD/HSP70 family sugar kinase
VRWPVGLFDDDLSITVSIHGLFEEKFGIPTFVDNDANAAVFGEEWYGKGLGVQHAVYLYSGNGCGLLINGQIYRGATGCAGEWLFEAEENPLPVIVESHRTGEWSIDLGISLRAQAAMKDKPDSKVLKLAGNDPKKITIHTVTKAAQEGDAFAVQLLKDAGKRLARKAAFLVNLFNPELIVIGGGIEAAGAPLLDSLRDSVKQISIPEATDKLRVIPAALGENGVPLGAAAFVAQNYFISV